ncbi:non-hydrolyzing UDP-N-acetylglucosamine 2-epimerase [Gulosibacter sp. 10]|uniref:non-hydrolyzing UDP-N-acetylglucosamine 2-epimerase n=1 Tax=Gulosibacter sp. 10 TaxID=1255570 RepID=UPI00097F471C|nr:UDP-N-acetylglucosamine 2-epimerase (non-hydrolyzing) [Gulosibacter sp. 10]SJM59801.1 UDP-N-acetylglucosamine 2-epimerase [Gulosibacter sp. 10]
MTVPKVITVYGTRPEAIKVAPVVTALEADDRFDAFAVSTGQHREMLDQVNSMFGITPKYDLGIMRPGQSLNQIVSRVVEELDAVIEKERPDAILVHGDTSTAMSAAITAFNREVRVVHVEAGLRTGNLFSPFPEEANRRLISRVASLHLAPTAESRENLLREQVDASTVPVTGNTVIDALLEATAWNTTFADERLQQAADSGQRLVLITTHRRENLDTMSAIGKAMRRLSEQYTDINFVLPAHLNPRVRDAVFPHIEGRSNIIVTDPLPYNEFTKLMGRAALVLTDSGGVQEEAPSLGKPVLVMRENTERPEAIEAGTVRLVGTDEERIVAESARLLDDDTAYREMANAVNPYGDGKAAERSVAAIAELLGVGQRLPDFSPVHSSE